jgi:hypothetical protein
MFHAQNVPRRLTQYQFIEVEIDGYDSGSIDNAAIGQDGKLYFFSSSNNSSNKGVWRLDDDGKLRQTNITGVANFTGAATGQDGRLYFYGGGSSYNGVWRLDDDGDIRQVSQSVVALTNSPTKSIMGPNGKLYFYGPKYSVSHGTWYLDYDYGSDDWIIKPTNIIDDTFSTAATGPDGKLYFGGYSENGVWRLDDDGDIRQVSAMSNRPVKSIATGQNGKIYFGDNDDELWYLDDDGVIKKMSGSYADSFDGAIMGQNGKIYFYGTGTNAGIRYLDYDSGSDNWIVKPTTHTGSVDGAIMGPDNKVYFYNSYSNAGIRYLDYDSGSDNWIIKLTNVTSVGVRSSATGQDGRLYFGFVNIDGNNDGIWYLDDDGDIKRSNVTDYIYYCAITGTDGKLYFAGHSGVYRLDQV